MPVHINLIHEEKAELRARQRDPVKLGLIGAGVIIVCLAGLYFVKTGKVRSLKKQNTMLVEEWKQKEPLLEAAESEEKVSGGVVATANTLTAMSEERFYWAPLLEGLLQAVPPAMSIESMTGNVSLSSGKEKSGHNVTAVLKGQSAGQDPRQVAEDVRLSFLERMQNKHQEVQVIFDSLDDNDHTVTLDGQKLKNSSIFH